MLKKIIAAAISCAMLANPSMIVSAEDSNVDNSFVAETETTSVSMETTAVSTDMSVETTTSIVEEKTLEEIGEDVRRNLNVNVRDVIYFDGDVYLEDNQGDIPIVGMGQRIWLIAADDENQRFRAYVPKFCTKDNGVVLYLDYSKVEDARIETHEGLVIGDLNYDGKTNVFDMCLMRRGYINGWEDPLTYILADMNSDGSFSIADLVYLQQWLLGAIK